MIGFLECLLLQSVSVVFLKKFEEAAFESRQLFVAPLVIFILSKMRS